MVVVTAGTTVKAVHFNQARTAINALRAAAGLGPGFGSNVSAGQTIGRFNIELLREALDQARAALGLMPQAYTDSLLFGTADIKATHVNELRSGVQ